MSEPEFVPSDEEESESSSSGEEYVASEEEAPQRKRPLPRPSNRGGGGGGAAAAAAPKRQRAAQQPKLPDLLQSASKEQLVALVLSLNQQAGGQLEGRIGDLLPPPDLTGIKAGIAELERKVSKAFPHAKWGTNRDNYAYKRVGPALRDLKAALLEQARTFDACKRHASQLEYAPYALRVAAGMPHWDADAHNKVKQQAISQLEGLLVKAVKASAPPPAQRAALLAQLDQLGLPLDKARAALA